MSIQNRNAWSVLVLFLALTLTAHAQETTGSWAIEDLQIANKVQLSLNVTRLGKGTSMNSSTFDLAQFRGLTASQLASPIGTMARFEIVREAGTFLCEGYLKSGSGAGTFRFQPNPDFVSQMRGLGFLDISEDRQFSMATHDVGPRFASELRATGVAVSSGSQLVSMKIHGVSAEFVQRMQQVGLRPDSEDLVKMRIHGVTPEFANEVRRMYPSASIESLVRMRIHGVTNEFARDVQSIYNSASLDDLVRLRIHGVTLDYIRRMQSRTRDISLEQLVRLKIHGIE